MSATIYDCIVIGAGAAGLFYAAADDPANDATNGEAEAETNVRTGSRVILEKTDRPGQKLLMSGNGACNITHGGSIKEFISHYADKGPKIRSCLYQHNNLELMKFLEDAGVPLVAREDGKVFPASMQAKDVLDALLAKAARNGFEMQCSCEVTGMEPAAADADNVTAVTLADGHRLRTRKLVIATGGASYPATGSDGSFMEIMHRDLGVRTTALKPALAPVYVEHYPYAGLAGVSFPDVSVTCSGHTMRGPLLFTHKGMSGPVMLHISQYVTPGMQITINYLPNLHIADVFRKIRDDQPANSKGIANYLAREFGLPKAFTETMFRDPTRKLSSVGHKELENIVHLIMERKHTVSGTGGFREAMVTAGGVYLEDMDLRSMCLKSYPSIHIIGEALDINGDTGGYNLQFAYSSARATIR